MSSFLSALSLKGQALKSLSLVCKSLRHLVSPQLFSQLTLSETQLLALPEHGQQIAQTVLMHVRTFYLSVKVDLCDLVESRWEGRANLHIIPLFIELRKLKLFVWDVNFGKGAIEHQCILRFLDSPLCRHLPQAILAWDQTHNNGLFSINIRISTYDGSDNAGIRTGPWHKLLHFLQTGSRRLTFFPISVCDIPRGRRRHSEDIRAGSPYCEVTLLLPSPIEHFLTGVIRQGTITRLRITIADPSHVGLRCLFACSNSLETVYIKPAKDSRRDLPQHEFLKVPFPRLQEIHFKLLSAKICDSMLDLMRVPLLRVLSYKLTRAELAGNLAVASLGKSVDIFPVLHIVKIIACCSTGVWQEAVTELEQFRLRLEILKIDFQLEFRGDYAENSMSGLFFNRKMPAGLLPCFRKLELSTWAFWLPSWPTPSSDNRSSQIRASYPNVTQLQLVTYALHTEACYELGLKWILRHFRLPALQRLYIFIRMEELPVMLEIIEEHLLHFPALREIVVSVPNAIHREEKDCPDSFKVACARLGIKAGQRSDFTYGRI